MPRRKSENPISIFPFLAVLVCTMGALILLLLVTTRRIHNEQMVRLVAEAERPADESSVESHRGAAEDEADDAAVPATFLISSADVAESDETHMAFTNTLLPPPRPHELRAAADAAQEKVTQLQQQITHVTEQRQRLVRSIEAAKDKLRVAGDDADRIESGQTKLAGLKLTHDQLSRELTERQRTLRDLVAELETQSKITEDAERVLKKRETALVSLRKIAKQQSEAGDDVSAETVIEFTNATGTQRSPIIVDVRETGFRLVPSGVNITSEDMNGFPANDNPLLSTILAVHDVRQPITVSVRPYVLLLVRPSGSMAFYTAQRVLSEAGIHFGYELLDDERRIRVSAPETGEKSAAQKALLAALERRRRLYGGLLAQVNSLKQRSRQREQQTGRRATVLPDGRIVESQGDQSIDGRFYAGGEAPVANTGALQAWDRAVRDMNARDTVAEGSGSVADSEEKPQSATGDSFPPLVASRDSTEPSDVAQPMIIAGSTSGAREDSPKSLETSGEEKRFPTEGPPQRETETGAATFLPPDASTAMQDGGSDRAGSQRRSGWSNPGDADLDSSTRTAGTAEDPAEKPASVFGSDSTAASDARAATGNVGMSPTSDSQRFLQRFFDSVADSKEQDSTPDPFLLALLRSAEAETDASQADGDGTDEDPPTGKRDSAAKRDDAADARPTGISIILGSDTLKVGSRPAIGTAGWETSRLFAAILDELSRELRKSNQSDEANRIPVVDFVVDPQVVKTRQELSRRLAELNVATRSVRTARNDRESETGDLPVIEPWEPARSVRPSESPDSGTSGARTTGEGRRGI